LYSCILCDIVDVALWNSRGG